MGDLVTPLVFVGGSRASPIEVLLADAQEAIARDLIDRLLGCPSFEAPVVATSSVAFAHTLAGLPVRLVPDEGGFHFGQALASLIRRYDVEHAFYIGGGAAPLLTAAELTAIASLILTHRQAIVANNFFSSDFLGFTPAGAIHQISLPPIDNDLAFRLQREAGLENVPLMRTPGTQMDVDTPTDLLILALHPGTGSYTRRFLDSLDLDTSRIERVSSFLTDPTAQVIVAGRVGSHVWSHLDSDLACRTRVFSEERGMRASGRESRGDVRSMLGFHLEAVGPDRFFAHLSELGDAAFLDTRVLFNHLRLTPSASDRFYSDLLQVERIQDPTLREFTHAAANARIPVVLGGHSLVAGGLWALIDAAWLKRDQESARVTSG